MSVLAPRNAGDATSILIGTTAVVAVSVLAQQMRAGPWATFAAIFAFAFASPSVTVRAEPKGDFRRALSDSHILDTQIIGCDINDVPCVCGTASAVTPLSAPSPRAREELPGGTRSWECIPSVILDDGIDTFRLEVDANGPVRGIVVDRAGPFVEPPEVWPAVLRDDGLGEDRVAGDSVFTSGLFRYDTTAVLPVHYGLFDDPASVPGLHTVPVGELLVEELDATSSRFLVQVGIGILRSDIEAVVAVPVSPDIVVSPHLINIRSNDHATQRFLHVPGAHLVPNLTARIYDVLPDAFDFLMLFSTNKVELLPPLSSRNFVSGVHTSVQVNYTGNRLSPLDNSAAYGSMDRLLGINALDTYNRGTNSQNATHELIHQWVSYADPSLGLNGGGAHYQPRSSAASLVGGFEWIQDMDGHFILNCNEGRNGAHHAPPWDQYMMGLIAPEQVHPLFVDENIHFPTDCGGYVGPTYEVAIQDMQRLHGPRTPGPEAAQRDFRIAFVAESHNRLLNATELTYYDTLAGHYAAPIPPDDPDPRVASTNWVSIARFFGEGTTWCTRIPLFGECANSTTIAVALRLVDSSPPALPEGGPLPSKLNKACFGGSFSAEVWVTQVDGETAGVAGGTVDLHFDPGTVEAESIVNAGLYGEGLGSGTIDNTIGLVNDVGGITVDSGRGVAPDWMLLARVRMRILAGGPVQLALAPGAVPFALAGDGVPLEFATDVYFDTPQGLEVTATGDMDCDADIDLDDYTRWLECVTDPAASLNSHPLLVECNAADFDQDWDVDLRDLAGFQRDFGTGLK